MLERAAEGFGHIALVSGEAGAGKTTLIDAFIHSGASSARVLRGACEDLSIPDPLGPLYDLARHAQWALDTQSVERSRLSLFSQALDVFEMSEQPTVLAIEDVHWADDATLDFIRFIGRRIAGTHILLIVTARNDGSEGQRRVRRALADIPSDNLARIEVPLLSEAAVSQMAREAGQDGSAIYRATAGNAFFVSELLRAGRSGTVPPGVRDAVLARAERLSPAGRKALDAVSVFPRRAEAQAILMMLGEEAENSLNECVATGMLSQAGSFYMFRHEIARTAIEAALTSRTRISLNAAALAALRRIANVPAARLLHHAAESQDDLALHEFAPAAAAEAVRLGAHREAARLSAAALNVIPTHDHATRAALLEQYAFESHLVGAISEAIAAQNQARQIYSELGDKPKEGDCLRWLSRLSYLFGDRIGADAYAREALHLLEKEPPGPELAMAYSNLAHLGMLGDHIEETLNYGRKAISIGEQFNRDDIVCHSLNNVGTVLQWLDAKQARADLSKSLEIALAAGYQEHAARAYTNAACVEINLLAYDRADEVLGQGIDYCIARDLDTWRDYMRAWKAELLMRQGQWDQAADAALLVLNNEQTTPLARYPATLALARIRVRRGDPASDLLEGLSRYLERGMELQRLAPYATLMAERAWLGEVDCEAALQLVDQAIAMLPSRRVYGELVFWRQILGGSRADLLVGELARPYAELLAGDWQSASEAWEEIEAPYDHALCLLVGDRKAQASALEVFRRLGAAATAKHVVKFLREDGVYHTQRGPYQAARENVAGLTSREMDVLRLVSQGQSNKAIALSLNISPKTVDHHVSAVLGKLEAKSRAEAAAMARAQGMI